MRNLRQEITPMLQMTGDSYYIGTSGPGPVKIHRKMDVIGVVDATSNTYDFTLGDLYLVFGGNSGATVTKFVVQNMTGRHMTVTCNTSSITRSAGTSSSGVFTNAPIISQSRFVSAPMTRFPKCKIDIPDAFAAPSNSTWSLATNKVITVVGSNTPKDTIKITVSFWKMVN